MELAVDSSGVTQGLRTERLWTEFLSAGFQLGGVRSLSLLFADDVVLLAPFVEDLRLSLERFTAECEVAGMRVSTSKSKTMVLSQKRVKSLLLVGSEVRPQVEEFKNIGVLFTSDGRREREIGRRIGAASVLWTLYRSAVVKRELSQKVRLSVYQSIFVPTLTCGHELWIVTER